MLLGSGADLLPREHGPDLDGGMGGLETSSLGLPICNVGRGGDVCLRGGESSPCSPVSCWAFEVILGSEQGTWEEGTPW